jgi:uncharacterized protein (DUF736 family)
MNTQQKNNNTNTGNSQKNNDWSKREIGALWKKDGPSQKYLSGYLTIDELGTQTKVNVVVFSNKNKSKDTAPDFRVYLSKENTPNQASAQTTTQAPVKTVVAPVAKAKVKQVEEVEEDLL